MTSAPFVRFHARVGVRLAFRLLAPVLAGLFAFYYLLKPEFLLLLARQLFGRSTPLAQGAAVGAILLLTARMASLRVSFGLGGWLRHLPASARLERQTAAFAVFLAQAPLLFTLAALSAFGTRDMDRSILPSVAGLLVAAAAAAMTVVPSAPVLLRWMLGLPATVAAGSGRPALLLASVALLLILDRRSGGIEPARSGRLQGRLPPSLFWLGLDARALGWTIVLGPIAGFFPAALTRLFLDNNDLPAGAIPAAVRLGCALSLVVCVAVTSGLLAARRPTWPWSRSLARTSGRRILSDAAFLALPAAVGLIPFFLLDDRATLAGAALLPALAVRAAGAIQTASESRFGVSWTLTVEGSVGAMAIGLSPFSAILLLGLFPLILGDSRRRERNLKATRWVELRHSAAGDSLTWSGR